MEWIVIAGLVVAGVAGWWFVARPWRSLRARRVVVNLRSGQAIEGLLVKQSGPLLFIAEGQLMEAGSNAVPIDGQAVIERPNVDFIQVI